ncbi:MAG: hypothetical protein ACLPQY_27150 [Streptosporangiaceae bacterium]
MNDPRPQEPSTIDTTATDPFDPLSLRIQSSQEYSTEKVLTTVPVRKPKKDEFFRVHPDDAYMSDFLMVEREDGMDREFYIVAPACAEPVMDTAYRVRIFTWISKRGDVFLWPQKLPIDGSSGRAWSASALRIADEAKNIWCRMYGDRALGAYVHVIARGNLEEPKWPDKSFGTLLQIAFPGDRIINRPDHPYIRELNGEL